jgi:fatty acid desaturase
MLHDYPTSPGMERELRETRRRIRILAFWLAAVVGAVAAGCVIAAWSI